MIEKIDRKKTDRQEKQLPDSIEQLIEYYNLEKIWSKINEIIDQVNEMEG